MMRWLLAAVLFLPVAAVADDWRVANGETAQAVAIESSDGARAALEVRCRPEPDVRIFHPALARLPVDDGDSRQGWRRIVYLRLGWGLDLSLPDHHGWRSAWHRCDDRPDCLVAREADVKHIIRSITSSWSLFVRIEPPNEEPVDLRVFLTGSAQAIESVCADAD